MTECVTPEATPEFQKTGYSWEGVRALERVMQTGALLVRINNRTTQFQSTQQMILLRDDMRKTLNAEHERMNPCKRRPRAISLSVRRF